MRELFAVRAVFVAMFTVTVLAGSVDGQTFAPGGPLEVRDSNGELVGNLIARGIVSVVINGHPTLLAVERSRLTDFGPRLYFAGSNCTGTAYISGDSTVTGSPTIPAALAPDGTVRISPSFAGAPQTTLSYFHHPIGSCWNETNQLANALSTEVGPNLAAEFVPPFSTSASASIASAAAVPFASIETLLALVAVIAVFALVRLRV